MFHIWDGFKIYDWVEECSESKIDAYDEIFDD